MRERTHGEISEGLLDLQQNAGALFRSKPNLAMAVVTVVAGGLAILIHLPTRECAVTLAGALFGAKVLDRRLACGATRGHVLRGVQRGWERQLVRQVRKRLCAAINLWTRD